MVAPYHVRRHDFLRRVLAVENERGAGPEKFEDWLADAGLEVEICRPYVGDSVPDAPSHEALLVLGGEMGAGDDHRAPWLGEVRSLLSKATVGGQPVFGICLGAQLLAAACGGRVGPSRSGGELGLCQVELNDQSHRDAALWRTQAARSGGAVARRRDHRAAERGRCARLEPRAALCRRFASENAAWGVQFHPEVSACSSWAPGRLWTMGCHRRAVGNSTRLFPMSLLSNRSLFELGQCLAERFAAVVKQS